jgi:phage portal protein BeeE
MQKAMTEDLVANSPMGKLLNNPNRNQTQGEFIEQIFGLRELQGEGNVWFPRDKENPNAPPKEMFSIPKPHIQLIGNGVDPWEVLAYQFTLHGKTYRWDKKDLVMWKYSNPTEISITLEHLRGLAPLSAFMVSLQGMNEADLRVAASNKNGGAYGFAFREDLTEVPTKVQSDHMRRQFDEILYRSDMTGKVGILGGKWGYHNIGMNMEQQKLLEQYGVGFKRLCRVFKTPSEIFGEGNDTYENQKQYKRMWIYDKIAPAVYQLREMLSGRLLREFSLDQESHIVDCDIMSLPEMAEDLGKLIAAVKDAWWMTPNQRLIAQGYEPALDPNMDRIWIPTGMQLMDDAAQPLGGNLDQEINQLNQ